MKYWRRKKKQMTRGRMQQPTAKWIVTMTNIACCTKWEFCTKKKHSWIRKQFVAACDFSLLVVRKLILCLRLNDATSFTELKWMLLVLIYLHSVHVSWVQLIEKNCKIIIFCPIDKKSMAANVRRKLLLLDDYSPGKKDWK